jgi:outer membrane protein assembly factor BamB
MSRTRRLASVALAVTLAGCVLPEVSPTGSPETSAGPTTAPSATASSTLLPTSPEPSAEAGSWSYETDEIRGIGFGHDGTTYLFTWSGDAPSRLVALDEGGEVVRGWPVSIGTESTGIGSGPTVAPDGSVLVLAFAYTGSDLTIEYSLHRYGPDGAIVDGWPHAFAAGEECGGGVLDGDGRVLVGCGTESGSRVVALDAAGDVSWEVPVSLPVATELRLGSDGTVFVGSAGTAGGLAALTPDGEGLPGWPIRIDNPYGYGVAPTGAVLVWWRDHPTEEICNEGGSTVYLSVAEDGGVPPGWPQVVAGPASSPAFGSDGTIYVTDAADHLYAFEPDGAIPSGWPVTIRATTGTCFGPPDPAVGPDGTIYVATGGRAPAGALVALDPDGRPRAGWPYVPDGELAYPCIGCTPGPADPSPPLFGANSLFVVTYPAEPEAVGDVEILAFGADASMRPGWPLRLNVDEAALHRAPDGRLFAVLVDTEDFEHTTLLFIPDPPPAGSGG